MISPNITLLQKRWTIKASTNEMKVNTREKHEEEMEMNENDNEMQNAQLAWPGASKPWWARKGLDENWCTHYRMQNPLTTLNGQKTWSTLKTADAITPRSNADINLIKIRFRSKKINHIWKACPDSFEQSWKGGVSRWSVGGTTFAFATERWVPWPEGAAVQRRGTGGRCATPQCSTTTGWKFKKKLTVARYSHELLIQSAIRLPVVLIRKVWPEGRVSSGWIRHLAQTCLIKLWRGSVSVWRALTFDITTHSLPSWRPWPPPGGKTNKIHYYFFVPPSKYRSLGGEER